MQVTKERASFCEGVYRVWHRGRKVQLDNESLFLEEQRWRDGAIFIHPHLPPSLTNQAWNDYDIKHTWVHTILVGSRLWCLCFGHFFSSPPFNVSFYPCMQTPFSSVWQDCCKSSRWGMKGWKRDRFTVRFIEASQTAFRPRFPPLGLRNFLFGIK